MNRLENKTALITGAARGIGLSIAEAFKREGAMVLMTDIRDELGRSECDRLGPQAAYRRLDVREESDWIAAMNDVRERWDGLDILVNNAGITGFEDYPEAHDPERASLQAWRGVHATNLDGTFLGCKHAIRAMRAAGTGSIINISSRSGLVGIPAAAAYASSKAAVRNHSKSVALYCASQGLAIRCNSIHPAAILTPIWEPMLGDGPDRAERMDALVADTPLRRFGRPEEVAEACMYLGSDESAYMTGSELNLDGGLLAGSAAAPSGD